MKPPPTPKKPVSAPTPRPPTTVGQNRASGQAPVSSSVVRRRALPGRVGGGEHHGDEREDQDLRADGVVAERAEQRPGGGRHGERQRDAPADVAAQRERAGADAGGDRDDDQRRGGCGTDRLAEHVDEHGQREDRRRRRRRRRRRSPMTMPIGIASTTGSTSALDRCRAAARRGPCGGAANLARAPRDVLLRRRHGRLRSPELTPRRPSFGTPPSTTCSTLSAP